MYNYGAAVAISVAATQSVVVAVTTSQNAADQLQQRLAPVDRKSG